MLINRTLLAAAVTAALAASVGASAQDGRPGAEHGFAQVLRSVQLSADQKSQVHQIMRSARTQDAPQLAQLQALHQQIEATLLSAGTVTAAQIAPLQQQVETLRQQLDASHIQTALAIRAVMTSAQLATASSTQAKLASLHQQEHAILTSSPVASPE